MRQNHNYMLNALRGDNGNASGQVRVYTTTPGLLNWAFKLLKVEAIFGVGKANQFLLSSTNGVSLTDAADVVGSSWDPTCTTQVNVEGLTPSEFATYFDKSDDCR